MRNVWYECITVSQYLLMNQQDQKGMSNLSFVGCHTTTQKDLDTTIEDSLYRDVPELLLENIIHQSK